MHDTHLLKNILKYFEDQEKNTSRCIKKAYFSISEFGSLSKEHFLEHFYQATNNTRFKDIEVEVKVIPFGSELEITKLEFTDKGKES